MSPQTHQKHSQGNKSSFNAEKDTSLVSKISKAIKKLTSYRLEDFINKPQEIKPVSDENRNQMIQEIGRVVDKAYNSIVENKEVVLKWIPLSPEQLQEMEILQKFMESILNKLHSGSQLTEEELYKLINKSNDLVNALPNRRNQIKSNTDAYGKLIENYYQEVIESVSVSDDYSEALMASLVKAQNNICLLITPSLERLGICNEVKEEMDQLLKEFDDINNDYSKDGFYLNDSLEDIQLNVLSLSDRIGTSPLLNMFWSTVGSDLTLIENNLKAGYLCSTGT